MTQSNIKECVFVIKSHAVSRQSSNESYRIYEPINLLPWIILDIDLGPTYPNPMEFFLNVAELPLNSLNSGNQINHWSINWAKF